MKNQDNYILYLDTSEKEAVIAIYNNHNLIKKERWLAYRELSSTLVSKYQEILKKAGINQKDLSGICVFQGPGSFTGLRIGISFANALSFGLEIPIYATKEKDKLNLSNKLEIVVPEYGAEPNITKPKNQK